MQCHLLVATIYAIADMPWLKQVAACRAGIILGAKVLASSVSASSAWQLAVLGTCCHWHCAATVAQEPSSKSTTFLAIKMGSTYAEG